MESNWYRFYKHVDAIFGVEADLEERFFICPECGEPIYECDWIDSDYWLGQPYAKKWHCPICENELVVF